MQGIRSSCYRGIHKDFVLRNFRQLPEMLVHIPMIFCFSGANVIRYYTVLAQPCVCPSAEPYAEDEVLITAPIMVDEDEEDA